MRAPVATALLLVCSLPGLARADDAPVTWGGSVDGGAPRQGARRQPFEPDTETKLTGEDLAARGATNLAEALDLLPDVSVRVAGRGGQQAEVRGARKSWLKILVDGVPVDDPYYGNFDISSIPVTDIVEIRLSTAPASPLDGPGGPGGVIEVITLRALGARRLAARAQASDAPNAAAWVTGRANVFPSLGLRASAGGTLGAHEYDVTMADGARASLGESTRQAHAALRLESSSERGDVGLDVFAQHRSYVTPPSEDMGADVLVVDGEETARAAMWGETWAGGWRMRGQGYFQALSRDSRSFADATLASLTTREALSADREGVGLTGNRGLGAGVELVLAGHFDSEHARVDNLAGRIQGGRANVGELAAGLQWRHDAWRADTAAGVTIPDGATPWPEAKLGLAWQPIAALGVDLTGARKGRVPTLRERYQQATGNDALAPESSTSLDLGLTLRPLPGLRVRSAAYVRAVSGYIRLDTTSGKLSNIGDLTLRGVDNDVTYDPFAALGVGASYRYEDARSAEAGDEPLDFLPRHKLDAWLSGRWGQRAGATARVRYVGRRIDQMQTLPAYATGDLSGFYRLGADLRGTLRVDNLLDNRFEVRANGYRDPGRRIMLGVEGVWE